MTNKNSTQLENCNSCNYCDSCKYCNSCYSCDYCNYCDYCNSCYSCDYCNYCDYCNSCNSCDYCNYCYYCDYCDYCNYCYFSTGLRMSEKMIFCVGEGKYERKGTGYQKNLQIFNTPVTDEEYKKVKNSLDIKNFKLPVATWIDVVNIENPTNQQKQLGGYLKTLSYKEAWTQMWNEMSTQDRNFFTTIPHFNSNIFEQITGIKYEVLDDATENAINLLKENGYKIIKE